MKVLRYASDTEAVVLPEVLAIARDFGRNPRRFVRILWHDHQSDAAVQHAAHVNGNEEVTLFLSDAKDGRLDGPWSGRRG